MKGDTAGNPDAVAKALESLSQPIMVGDDRSLDSDPVALSASEVLEGATFPDVQEIVAFETPVNEAALQLTPEPPPEQFDLPGVRVDPAPASPPDPTELQRPEQIVGAQLDQPAPEDAEGDSSDESIEIPEPSRPIEFVRDDGQIEPIRRSRGPWRAEPESEPEVSPLDTLGVEPPPPTPQSAASGVVQFDHRFTQPQAILRDPVGTLVDENFTGGEQARIDGFADREASIDNFSQRVVDVTHRLTFNLWYLTRRLEVLYDALACERSDEDL